MWGNWRWGACWCAFFCIDSWGKSLPLIFMSHSDERNRWCVPKNLFWVCSFVFFSFLLLVVSLQYALVYISYFSLVPLLSSAAFSSICLLFPTEMWTCSGWLQCSWNNSNGLSPWSDQRESGLSSRPMWRFKEVLCFQDLNWTGSAELAGWLHSQQILKDVEKRNTLVLS